MGQQQLLLVILVTIIVGIATVVAINVFSSQSESANVDAVRQDMLSMAATAQQYYMKPTALGGGGQDFTSIEMQDLAFPGTINSATSATNENGDYSLGSRGTSSFQITGNPTPAGGSIVMTVEADTAYISTPWTGSGS